MISLIMLIVAIIFTCTSPFIGFWLNAALFVGVWIGGAWLVRMAILAFIFALGALAAIFGSR
jgi:hypothetical protein